MNTSRVALFYFQQSRTAYQARSNHVYLSEALLAAASGRDTDTSVSQDNHLRAGDRDISFKGHVQNVGAYIDTTRSMVKRTDYISRFES